MTSKILSLQRVVNSITKEIALRKIALVGESLII